MALRAKEADVLRIAKEACEVFLKEGDEGTKKIDLRDMFARLTLDVVFKLMLDIDLGSLRYRSSIALVLEYARRSDCSCFSRHDPDAIMVRQGYDKSITMIPVLLATVPFLKHATFIPFVREHRKIAHFNTQYLAARYEQFCKRYEQANPEEKQQLEGTLLYCLMRLDEAKDPDFSPIGELKMFVAAGMLELHVDVEADSLCAVGFETTAHSLTWILYDLMRYPEARRHPV
jgi:hypothetical protein